MSQTFKFFKSPVALFSQVVSFVLHPIFIPMYGVLCYFFLSPRYFLPVNIKFMVYYVLILAIIIPFLVVFLFRLLKIISSLDMKNIKGRLYFSIIMAGDYYIIFKKVSAYHQYIELIPFFLGIFLSIATLVLFNYFNKKPSIHAMAMGGITAFFIIWSYYTKINILFFLSGLIVVSSISIAARLYLKAHSSQEVATGLVVGILMQFLSFSLIFMLGGDL